MNGRRSVKRFVEWSQARRGEIGFRPSRDRIGDDGKSMSLWLRECVCVCECVEICVVVFLSCCFCFLQFFSPSFGSVRFG